MISRLFLVIFPLLLVSARAQGFGPFVSGPWSGNVTATSATVVARLARSGVAVRLVASRQADLSAPIFSDMFQAEAVAGNAVKFPVDGLQPGTEYFYGFEVEGRIRTEPALRGSFRTFPAGAASFKLAVASCGDFRDSDQRAYDAILAERPLLFINTGDLHYVDTNVARPEDYRRNYDSVLTQANQAALYRNVPVAYVWDDHDFCGNDSNGTSVGREAARQVYRETVPHYPLPLAGPIAQAFTVGRVRVIMTDLRSEASPRTQRDDAAKTNLGRGQKAWFKQELIAARDAQFPLILWVSSTPWIGPAGTGNDDWSVYATERRELANFVKDNGIKNLVLVCGDMHALAYDDGTHSDYADGGGAPLVVLHASALTRVGSSKGGPYAAGPHPGSGQYGVIAVTDNGGSSVGVTFTGYRVGEGAKLSYTVSAQANLPKTPAAASAGGGSDPAPGAFTNVSSLSRITTADGAAVCGFVIVGKWPRSVVVRAVGPSLATLGVTETLGDPRLSVHQGEAVIARNANWGDGGLAPKLAERFIQLGAFPFSGAASADAALELTLDPGVYTVAVHSSDGGTGRVLLEVYAVP